MSEARDGLTGQLHGEGRHRGDGLRDLHDRLVQGLGGHDPRDDPVRQRLGRIHDPARQDEIAGDAVACHLEQPRDASGVWDDTVRNLGESKARVL